MKTWLTTLGACSLLLAGCAASTDPHEGGFFGGVQGLSSGEYERRVQEREENLRRLRELQADLDSESAQLEGQKHDRAEALAAERRKLARLDADVKLLDAEVAKLTASSSATEQQIADLNRRLADLKRRLAEQSRGIDALEGGGEGTADADVLRRQLEQQREALQREYEALLEFALKLAR